MPKNYVYHPASAIRSVTAVDVDGVTRTRRGTNIALPEIDAKTATNIFGSGMVAGAASGAWCRFHRVAVASSPVQSNPATTAGRFDEIICQMNASNRTWITTLRSTNPALSASGYQETFYTRNLTVSANGYTSDGASAISEEQAAAGNWYAKTAGNALITNQIIQAPDNLLNPAISALQTAWPVNVKARMGSIFDGVFADDVNYQLDTSASAFPAAYPTNAAWWTAVLPFLATIKSNLYQVRLIPNLGKWPESYTDVNKAAIAADGGFHEFFTLYGYANDAFSGWYDQDLIAMDACVAAGKRFYAQVHGTATNARYGFATFLLGASATDPSLQSIGYSGLQDYTNEYWIPEFDYAIGSPLESRVTIAGTGSDRGFRRYYSNGVTIVNPKYRGGILQTSNVTFSLNRAYTGSGFTAQSSITLAPGLGAVLV